MQFFDFLAESFLHSIIKGEAGLPFVFTWRWGLQNWNDPMANERILYESLFRAFGEADVRYVVIGGFALNLHGIPRLTADLDLIVGLTPSNLEQAVRILGSLGYEPRLPVPAESILDPFTRKEWQETKNLVGFSFIHPKYPEELVDIIIHKENRFEDYFEHRELVEIKGFSIPIINLEHLKELKSETGRKQDIADLQMIYTLEKIKAEAAKGKAAAERPSDGADGESDADDK